MRRSSPSLQDASLADMRAVLEVEDVERWREIPKYPDFLKLPQFRAWHGRESSHALELIFSLRRMDARRGRRPVAPAPTD